MRFFKITGSIIILIVFVGCGQEQKSKPQQSLAINVGPLAINLPPLFRYAAGKGVDSYIGYIIDTKNDTFTIEYGNPHVINDLFGSPPGVFPISQKDWLTKKYGRTPSPDEALFSKSPDKDIREGTFLQNFYLYDTINNLVEIIVQPKRIGHGITGIYIAELADSNSISIYGENLDSSSHIMALDMYRSIRYRNR